MYEKTDLRFYMQFFNCQVQVDFAGKILLQCVITIDQTLAGALLRYQEI